jgi:hypothetical protein
MVVKVFFVLIAWNDRLTNYVQNETTFFDRVSSILVKGQNGFSAISFGEKTAFGPSLKLM